MRPYYHEDFPALLMERSTQPSLLPPLAYLDNAATTQKPSFVLEALEGFYVHSNANPYRGAYRTGVQATKLYECSRHIVADFVGARPHEVVFTRNTTESLNLVAYSYALEQLGPGDEVALPLSEHHSNLVTWQYVCKKTGSELVYLIPDEKGRLPSHEIESKIGPNTRILALAHSSNVLGTMHDIASITKHAHAYGATVILDCAQSIAHQPLDFRALDVDFAAFSGHKVYGPMGIGVLYGKEEYLERLPPFLYGGEMIDMVRERATTFEDAPKRFEAGTPNVAGAIGLAAAFEWLQGKGFPEIEAYERSLTQQLLDGLASIGTIQLYGNPENDPDRLGVVSFNVAGSHTQDIAIALDDANIAVRSGAHCAQPLHRHLGIEESLRVSPCLYNTPDEIDRLLDCLEHARRKISRKIMAVFP